MDERGVYAVARSIWSDPDFKDEPFTQREAWLWLVARAAWQPVRMRGNTGKSVDLERAEFSVAVSYMTTAWKWTSKSRVDRFIKTLENRGMIRDASRNGHQVYLINNYNDFQVVGLPKQNAKQNADQNAVGTLSEREENKEEAFKHSSIEGSKKVEAPAKAVVPKPSLVRGTRWPSDQEVPSEWFPPVLERFRELGRAPPDLRLEAVKFANYWAGKSGKDATKMDWPKTFLNWCLNARTDQRSFAQQRSDNLRTGASQSAFVDRERGDGVESSSDTVLRLAVSRGP